MNDTLEQVEPEKPDFKYANFGLRFLAYWVDAALYIGIAYLIWGKEVVNTDNGFHISLMDEQLLIPMVYWFGFWAALSTSPGKMLLRLKIIDESGEKIGPLKAFLRMLGYCVIIFGCWSILFDKEKRGLHDMIAKTFVVQI